MIRRLEVVRWTLLVSLVGTFLAAQASAFVGYPRPAPFKRLSPDHVNYGVSQFLAGNISQSQSYPLRLWNPGPVSMVACIFMYERLQLDCSETGGEPGGEPGSEPEPSSPCTQEDIVIGELDHA